MKQIFNILIFFCVIGFINSCQPAVHYHLTDGLYLSAPDNISEMGVCYREPGTKKGSYSVLISEMVIDVGFNDDFVIAKQQPSGKDTVLYYIIDVGEIKRERDLFVSKTDTIKTSTKHKDQNGNDSISVQTYIYTSKYSPKNPKPLTFEEFNEKRKQMNVSDSLMFTRNYENILVGSPAEKQILLETEEYKYTISVPLSYAIKESVGEDFAVYYFAPEDSTIEATFSGGVYFGGYPKWIDNKNDNCKKTTIKDRVILSDATWTVNNCDSEYLIQTLIDCENKEPWCRYIHIFGNATSEWELNKLKRIFKTFSRKRNTVGHAE